jgi:hypothetical protein
MTNPEMDDRESDFDIKQASGNVIFQPNNALMGKTDLREKDGRPQRIFFYNNLDTGKVMTFTEQEAAMMEKSSYRFILRQIGCSDGTSYKKHIRECGVKPGQVITKQKAQEILDGALAAEIEAARGHFDRPMSQSVHFDASFPLEQRPTFIPPK